MARYVYFVFAAEFPIVNLTRNMHAFCLLRARSVKAIDHVRAEEELMADTFHVELLVKIIVPK